MAARQRKHRETHGKGLFFVTLCLLAAGVVKYSSFPAAAEFRARAAEALAGAPGMEEALAYLSDGGFPRVRGVLAALSGATLLLCGLLCLRNDGGCWVLLTGTAICISALRMKKYSEICVF